MILSPRKLRIALALSALAFLAACTTQGPGGIDDVLAVAPDAASSTDTKIANASLAAEEANVADPQPAAGVAIPMPTLRPDAATTAFVPPGVQTPSANQLTQVASLEPAAALTGLAQAKPAAGYSYPDYKSRGAAFLSRDHECLARAMFFESNRSSRDGLIAVGSVVMNRLESGRWGNSVCEVVGAARQFAPGVLTRPMDSAALPDVMEAAQAVLKGERHPKIYKQVMFFHTAGYRYPYDNMHYVLAAGGNSFYEKRRRMRGEYNTPQSVVLAAARGGYDAPDVQPVALASTPVRAIAIRASEPVATRKVKSKSIIATPATDVVPVSATTTAPPAAGQAFEMPSADRFADTAAPVPVKSGRLRKPVPSY